jgi:iron-sulfur cluster assembly protein
MLTVTPTAAREVLAAAERSEAIGMALRVAARQEGDGSLAYGMGFDDAADDDLAVEVEGLTVLVSAACAPLLDGTVLDFVEMDPGRFHFIFIPPGACGSDSGAAASGGCGSGGCSSCSR